MKIGGIYLALNCALVASQKITFYNFDNVSCTDLTLSYHDDEQHSYNLTECLQHCKDDNVNVNKSCKYTIYLENSRSKYYTNITACYLFDQWCDLFVTNMNEHYTYTFYGLSEYLEIEDNPQNWNDQFLWDCDD